MILEFWHNLSNIWLESASWLILGLLIAGLMKALIPSQWMNRQLGANSKANIVKAALIGAPLPLCSCGVVPAALGLRRSGASKGSTVSFLVATPETGPDSITLSYALLGPFMAIVRPVAAVVSAIVAGLLVRQEAAVSGKSSAHSNSNCCAKTAAEPSCCDTASAPAKQSKLSEMKQGLGYAFGQLLADISGWLLFGILIAAAIQTFVPVDWLAQWGQGWLAMLLMAVIGVPMYICASASTPIAAGFLAAGVSPGAVLVFMLAGPATNIGTLGIIRKELGQQPLVAYLAGVIVCALGFGFLTDYLLQTFQWQGAIKRVADMEHGFHWLEVALALLLAGIIAFQMGQSLMGRLRKTAPA